MAKDRTGCPHQGRIKRSAPAALFLSFLMTALPALGGLSSWPPCIDVTFTGHGVTGLPPLSYRWEVSNGLTFAGNPGVLDTTLLPAGSYSARLRVSNTYGQVLSQALFFSIERLRVVSAPTCTALGNRQARCDAHAEGATESQWTWGDGQVSPWTLGLAGATATHTYAAAGTYAVRVAIRNCREPAITSAATSITVTNDLPLAILRFAALCPFGFCIFDLGDSVSFEHQVQGNPTTYAYDWNGDGIADQIAASPVLTHVFTQAGTALPRLTISKGAQAVSATVLIPLFIRPPEPGSLIFADGFESGTTAAWTLTVGRRP